MIFDAWNLHSLLIIDALAFTEWIASIIFLFLLKWAYQSVTDPLSDKQELRVEGLLAIVYDMALIS